MGRFDDTSFGCRWPDKSLRSLKLKVGNTICRCTSVQYNGSPKKIDTGRVPFSSSFKRRRKRQGILPNQVTITQHFSERVLTPGGDVEMQCAATADYPPQFVWERDGVPMLANTDQRYTIGQVMTDNGIVVSQLNISRTRVEDGGLYTCKALTNNNDVSASFSARLNIYGPPYIRTLPPLKVLSGQPIDLQCPYYGYPISKVEWEFKSQKFASSVPNHNARYKRLSKYQNRKSPPTFRIKRETKIINENGILRLTPEAKQEHAGLYTCIVTSPSVEMARRAFEVQVIEAPELDDLLMGSNLQEGQIVQITCMIRSGDTPIYFSWLKDGVKINANFKIEERNSELFSVLVIRKVSLEHCGTYTCIAANHAAKVNKSAELYIKVAPKWINEPQNTSLLLGHVGRIACSASGYPQPQVHWMKKDVILGSWQPVLDLVGSGVLSLPNGSLVIEMVSLADEGLYSCNVENGVGQLLSKTIWISVNKPVRFESNSANVTSRLGQPATLTCHAYGDHPIRIVWTHNSNPLEFITQRIKLSEQKTERGITSMANIQYAELRDAGVYQCRASNPYGVSTYSIHLTIQEPPAPPVELTVDLLKSRIVKISWRDTLNTHVQYYTMQYAPQQHYGATWDNAITVNVTRIDGLLRQSTDLTDLRPATAYAIRLASGNDVDLSGYSSPLTFNTLEEAPSSAPSNVVLAQTDNPGELKVSWQEPPKEALNGALLGYYIKAMPHNNLNTGSDDNTRTVKVTGQTKNSETILTGLLKNTRYAVTVCAYNSAGRGPYSMPIFEDTREGAPEQSPTSIDCTPVSPSSLKLTWNVIPVELQGGSLLGYTVLYAHEDGPWQNITTVHTELYLQGLLKYTNYTIKIAGYSNFGLGPFSYPTNCATQQDVPGPPADIKLLVLTSRSLLVSWKKPLRPNGILLHYTVYIKPSSSGEQAVSYRYQVTSESRALSHELRGLNQGRRYEVWITASTIIGEGEQSRRVTATPTNRVVAGISSLGGAVSTGVSSSLLLVCHAIGSPQPRTVWYHNQNIITHHPRYTLNLDDSLLINNIDQSLSGNYTCLAKNLFGSDSVTYVVSVLPLPDPPTLTATPLKDSIIVEWEQQHSMNMNNRSVMHNTMTYTLTWRERNGPWQEAWSHNRDATLNRHVLTGLRCGSKYSVRITATNSVGTSHPAYLDVSTLGGVPIAPQSNEWMWSNASHIFIQLSGWDENGCEISNWDVDYRELGTKLWLRAENKITYIDIGWGHVANHYLGAGLKMIPKSFAVGDLSPAVWYQLRIGATNEAGTVTAIYSYATKNINGEEIGPPTDYFDISMIVIVCSSVLLFLCLLVCIYVGIRRHRHGLSRYRDSITGEYKSESGNLTSEQSQNMIADIKENSANTQQNCNRLYSTPINVRKNSNKNEMYEISPYAQFAVGFRTFGHIDNQDQPGFIKAKSSCYNTETSFQMCSESEDSDSISKTTTLKSVPGKSYRQPHHR